MRIVLAANYLHPGLAAINEAALRSGRRWLLVKPGERTRWIGPLFEPGNTACWECLAERLRLNLPPEIGADGEPEILDSGLLPTAARAPALLDGEVARALDGGLRCGELITIDVATGARELHTLVRQPRCPACGGDGAPRMEGEPVRLVSRRAAPADGGYRVCSPEETLRRYAHHVSPVTGVVRGLRRLELPAAFASLHAFAAEYPVSAPARVNRPAELGFLRSAAGKGASEAQARASGLCEAIERSSGYYRGSEPLLRSSYADIAPEAVHPNVCMLYSERQYTRRAELNAASGSMHAIPWPFDERAPAEWVPAWSLTRKRVTYVPALYCYFGFAPVAERSDFCRADSNGCAAGNCLEEAVLQGALELVERDAVALWWYNRVQRPGVDLAGFDDPYLDAVRQTLATLGREVWLLDLTSDLGIPVFAALSRRVDGGAESIRTGFGAHLDARLAVRRAVTEMNQALAFSWTEGEPPADALEDRWWRGPTLPRMPYLTPDPAVPLRGAVNYPRAAHDDLTAAIAAVRGAIERQGLDMLVLDQTREDVGLPVVRVIVPGLRHIYPRFAPGRLYDVPVRLGWRGRALAEEELNPKPVRI